MCRIEFFLYSFSLFDLKFWCFFRASDWKLLRNRHIKGEWNTPTITISNYVLDRLPTPLVCTANILFSNNLWDLSEGKCCCLRTMSKVKIIVLCTVIVLIGWLMANGCEARWIQHDDDLKATASDKHEWKKANEKSHHQSDFAKHGKNSKKGYESMHGYVQFINHNFFHSSGFVRSIALKGVWKSFLRVLRMTHEYRRNIDEFYLHLFDLDSIWDLTFFFLLPIPNISEVDGKSGHHDKEEHEGEYDEKKGHKKNHHDDSGWVILDFVFFFDSKVRVYYLARWCWWYRMNTE